MVLQAIKYTHGDLHIIDQLQLPHRSIYLQIKGVQDAWDAIKSMQVRGAPAIAIVAALSLAVELADSLSIKSLSIAESGPSVAEAETRVVEALDHLITSRPTAVNLADAAKKLKAVAHSAATQPDATNASVKEAYIAAAEVMLIDDVQANEDIGKHGADWILSKVGSNAGPISVLTHCNTGSLATAGYGTALGVLRSLHSRGALFRAFYTETRPYNQGSRLTGYELIHDKIPATLITDSMAAALLSLHKGPEKVVAIVVGADRVAANGDTANKIGTYNLAILARFFDVKFLVAAPTTTIDLNTASGGQIVIEKRPLEEVTTIKGPVVKSEDGKSSIDKDDIKTISTAAFNTYAWNPAFDVTPAKLIDGIITEHGVIEKGDNGKFKLDDILSGNNLNGLSKKMPDPLGGGP